jgi:hypothetical protein
MILSSFHLIFKQFRSSLFRSIVVINHRQLSIIEQQKKDNEILIQSQNNHIEITPFTQKGIENILFFFSY